uniref:Reverse transcriptase domain-containing protein n=1 Tax=Tanacetum cinerariifolium TaxID=118510 RepID=A0A699GYH6_TANCI|nr:reverse transcriptase domain-containing protein [Tanacetum cinerariifolium]
MTTSVGNNSIFRSFFEKQKLTRPNFIDWYRQLQLVLSTEDKEKYLEQPIPTAPVAASLDEPIPHAALATYNEKGLEKQNKKTCKATKGVHRKGKDKMAYANVAKSYPPKHKNPPPPKKDNSAKDAIGHHCGEVGCGTHICNTTQGLRGIMVLNNCHYAPSINRGIISVSRLYDDGFINHFELNNAIFVSKNNVVYFIAIPRDGLYEIEMSCSNTNDSSMYVVSNKRAKLNLDSSLLWHCRLGHISKKCIGKLQHDGLLNSINIKSLGKCVSCMSGKMARKPYSHQVERAKDLLGLIHTDVCGTFRIVSRQGANYFVTFTDDFSRRWIRRIGNFEYAFSYEDLALIRRISFPRYGVLPRWENDPRKLGAAPNSMRGRNRRCSKQRIENLNLEDLSPPVVTMADQRSMAQLLQAPTEGYDDAIVVPSITADNFELKHGLLTLVQNKQFFGHDKEDPHAHVRYFNNITSTLKFLNVPNTSIKLMLFPFSLEGATQIWLEKEPPRLIFTWDDLVSKFINQFFPPSKTTNLRNEITNFQQRCDESFSETYQDSLNSDAGGNFLEKMPRECLAIIESKSKVHYSRNKPVVAKVSTNASTSDVSPDVAELKDMVKALLLDKKSQNQPPAPVKAVEESCVTYDGAHSYHNFPATDGNNYRDNIQEFVSQASAGNNFNQGHVYQPSVFQPPAYQAHAYQAPSPQTQGVLNEDFLAYVKANDAVMRNMQTQGQNMQNQLTNLIDLITKFVNSNSASTSSSGTLPSNTIANPKSDLAITNRSGVSYDGPQILPPHSSLPKVVENEPEVTKDTVNPTNNGDTEDVQPQAVQSESLVLISKPVTSLISKPAIALVSAPKPNPKASIPYPSRRNYKGYREKANNQIEKFYQIFKDMSFEISFADALILMPNFASTLKALIGNKEKLSEMAQTPLNEHCFVVLLKKLPKKLGDPGKFLIPCDFSGMAECLALADLGASINLMPFSVWKRLSLHDLTPTCMTLELANRSISRLVGVAEDVYVKVGSFHFLADFVVVDFDADPRVPLILRRSFLKTVRALIDVFEGELTLRVGKEAITFNIDQTSRYSANYSDMTAKRIDVVDMACEEYSQEVLGFSNIISSGNPTPYYEPIVSATSLTLTSFENNDFLLEEVDAFLAIKDEPTSSEFYQPYLDHEGDILLLEAFLNDDPSLPHSNQRNYLPEVRKKLKICEAKSEKSSIDEPPVVELKDLPPHLEYAFLEGDDKLPVIIAKDLSVEEKTALIPVLKSHKRAIAWKLSDIKGINPEFCTHKILMEEDFCNTPKI